MFDFPLETTFQYVSLTPLTPLSLIWLFENIDWLFVGGWVSIITYVVDVVGTIFTTEYDFEQSKNYVSHGQLCVCPVVPWMHS